MVFYGKKDRNLVMIIARRGLIAAGYIVFSYNGLTGMSIERTGDSYEFKVQIILDYRA